MKMMKSLAFSSVVLLPAWTLLPGGEAAGDDSTAARLRPIPVQLDVVYRLHVTTRGEVIEQSHERRRVQGGGCLPVVSHTDADFTGGQFIAQGGLAEGEIAAASYTIDAAEFPIQVGVMEMIFATMGATVTTTTQWSILVWEGTPATGNLVAQFSSDDVILPHIVLPPGTNGVNVQVSVDPRDPEQIVVQDNGTSTFSVGYRIDQHNNQTQNPCFIAPPSTSNAFPTVDVSGVASLTGNWLFGVNCGPLGCPANGGWANFQQLPGTPGSLCTPSGDWVLRASYVPFDCVATPSGACCLGDGDCEDDLPQDTCEGGSGAYLGDNSTCTASSCDRACCFEPSGCVDLPAGDCATAGGFSQALGTSCDAPDFTCFPSGACCNPDGSCDDDQLDSACTAGGGTFQGDGSLCVPDLCPQPDGACCLSNGNCLALPQSDCGEIPQSGWAGALTTCEDADQSGTADACEGGGCAGGTFAECADSDQDGVRDDNCVWWSCVAGSCTSTDIDFADIGGPFGACPPDGSADANDRFHALNCFANADTSGASPYPCEPDSPDATNVDAGGPFGRCCPDGVCDGNDAFHALNAFAGTNPCRCPAEGGVSFQCPCETPTDPPGDAVLCPPGPAPEVPQGAADRAARSADILLVAHSSRVAPGGLVDVDVLLPERLADLRGYQLHAAASGGRRGSLDIVDIVIQPRRDHVFGEVVHWEAFNLHSGQMVAGLDGAGIATGQAGYLATFTLRASRAAAGRFVVELLHGEPLAEHRSFLFSTTSSEVIDLKVQPAEITVAPRRGAVQWVADR